MNHSLKLTQRVLWPVFSNPESLARLLAFFENQRSLVHEISFFTEGDGGDFRVPPLEEVERRAAFLKDAVAKTRQRGFRTAINILNTLGHSDDGDVDPPPYRTVEGYDGIRCESCACPADDRFLSYIRQKYEAYGTCQADTYWMDDDLRFLHHAPIRQGCFCPECVEAFASFARQPIAGREDLIQRLQQEPSLRALWMERNTEVMERLIRTCAEAVHRQAPGADIGFMAGCRCYFQDQLDPIRNATRIVQSVQGKDRCALRVGAGYWSDARPREVLGKLLEVAVTASEASPGTHIGYELENYPFTRANKSAHSTGLEVLLAILTNRLDEALLDVMDIDGSGVVSQAPWFTDLAVWTPLWAQAAEIVAGTEPAGWRPAFSLAHWEQLPVERPLFPPKDLGLGDLQMLQLAGIPFSGMGKVFGHVLSQRAADGMRREELEDLLKAPLIMDAGAALRFCAAGLGEPLGIRSGQWQEKGTVEQFQPHPYNGDDGSYLLRATSKYFVGCPSASFQVTDDVQVLSRLANYAGRELGAATFFRCADGVRAAVLGHLPEPRLLRPPRIRQWRRLVFGLMTEPGPMVETEYPVTQWIRVDANGAPRLLVLWNAGFDTARGVRFEHVGATLRLSSPGVICEPVGKETCVTLPAWAFAVFSL